MGAIHDSMNEKLIASEIKEALEMLECATDLSTASLDAIREAIDSGNPLYCLTPKECNFIWMMAREWCKQGRYEVETIVGIFAIPRQATGEEGL